MFYSPEAFNAAYVATLSCSALLFLYLRCIWSKKVPDIFFWIHFVIVSWSALMYMNSLYKTAVAPFSYYADWTISTPLIMLAIGLTAMYPLKQINWSLLFGVMMTQVMVIISGLFAQICPTKSGMLAFFIAGNLIMLLVFYFIFGPFMKIAKENPVITSKYKKLSILFAIFWTSYPFVWIIGTPGYGIISPFATNLLFVLLPVLCKPVFGLVDLYMIKTINDK